MTVDFSKDVMIGMLRNGATGTQILDILNVIAPDEQIQENQVEATEPVAVWMNEEEITYLLFLIFYFYINYDQRTSW